MKFFGVILPLIVTSVLAAPIAEPKDGEASVEQALHSGNIAYNWGLKNKRDAVPEATKEEASVEQALHSGNIAYNWGLKE